MSGAGFNVGASPAPTNTQFFGAMPDKFTMFTSGQGQGITDNAQLNGFTAVRNVNQFTIYNLNMDGGTNTPTVTLGATATAPDGTNTAQKLVESTSNSIHCTMANAPVGNNGTIPSGGITSVAYRIGVFAKAAGRTRFALAVYPSNSLGSKSTVTTVFDLAGGQVGVAPTLSGGSSVDNPPWAIGPANVVPWPNGWNLCYMDFFPGAANGSKISICSIYLDNGSGMGAKSTSYTGDGTSGVIFWNAVLLPALAWNLSGQVPYFDDFNDLSQIDVNGTYVPGFAMYPSRHSPKWPNIAYVVPQTTAAQITQFAPSVMQLASTNNQGGWLQSCYPTGTGTRNQPQPNGFVGTTYQLPFLFEMKYKFDTTKQWSGAEDGIGHWTSTIEQLTVVNPVQGWIEHDMSEFSLLTVLGQVPLNNYAVWRDDLNASDNTSAATYNASIGYPTWHSTITYSTSIVVYFNSVLYQCSVATSLNQQPDINPGSWSVFTIGPSDNFTFPVCDFSSFHTVSVLWLCDPVYGNLGWVGVFFDGNCVINTPGSATDSSNVHFSYGIALRDATAPGVSSHHVLNVLNGTTNKPEQIDFLRLTQ